MKRQFMTLFVMLITFVGMAQTKDDVTLTVTGDGVTKEEAVDNALRSAIAQAYGVFVSANTQILNDEVVKDEIATVTSGNIKEYKEVAIDNLSNGKKEVTVRATVSISKLINYAKSKGAATEFAGATFARNMKIWELNKANEKKAICNELHKMALLLPSCYDRKLIVLDPQLSKTYDDCAELYMAVLFKPNSNFMNFVNSFTSVLKSLSLSTTEEEEYENHNLPRYEFYEKLHYGSTDYRFVLRNDLDYIGDSLDAMYENYCNNIYLKDNTGNVSKLHFYGKNGITYSNPDKCTGLFANTVENKEVEIWGVPIYKNVTDRYLIPVRSVTWLFNSDYYEEVKSPSFARGLASENFPIFVRFCIYIPMKDISKYSKFELVSQ